VKDNWKKIRLCEISEIIMGQSPPSKYYNDKKIGIPFFQGVTEFQEYSPKVKKYTTKVTKLARSNDILMSVRAPVGELNILKFDSCIGRGLCAIRSNEEIKFIYYLLKNYKKFIKTFSNGTTYESINKEQIGNLIFNIPSEKKERRKIASILSAYDELIENNNRRIEILEEMAQTIYKEWFVHFRFPGHEKVEMIDSELGKIPEGWEISDLGKIAKNKKESFVGQKHIELPLLDLARIPRKSLIVNNYGKYNEINTSRIIFEEEDILFGSIRPYFHKVIFAMKKGITNVSVLIIKPFNPNLMFPYLFWFLFDENTIKWATKQSGGTKMPVISWKILKRKKIIIPGNKILLKFNEIIFPIIHVIKTLNRTNENLKKTRDILLPKLISGTIDVSDLDIKIEEKK